MTILAIITALQCYNNRRKEQQQQKIEEINETYKNLQKFTVSKFHVIAIPPSLLLSQVFLFTDKYLLKYSIYIYNTDQYKSNN